MTTAVSSFAVSVEHRLRARVDSLTDALDRERRDHARTRARLELRLTGLRADVASLKQQIRWMERTKHHHG